MKATLLLLSLSSLQATSYLYSAASYIWGSGSSAVPPKNSEDIISEFEVMDGDFRSRSQRLSSSVEFDEQSKPTGPITACSEVEASMMVVSMPYTNSNWHDLLEHAEKCTRLGITCHFPIDGRKLHQSTGQDAIKTLNRMGHVIMIDPAHHNKPSQLTARGLRVAVSESARDIAAVIGKRPILVAISEDTLNVGQMEVLLREGYVPVAVHERSKHFLQHEVSHYPIFMEKRIEMSQKDGIIFVAADICTGFPAYVTKDSLESTALKY